jgi:hypothetical protein
LLWVWFGKTSGMSEMVTSGFRVSGFGFEGVGRVVNVGDERDSGFGIWVSEFSK